MPGPLFSVVMCVRDGAEYIGDALDSLAAQTFESFEVIVVDDGSSDNSGEIARAHAVEPRVIRARGHGEATARNRAIADAKGRYIAALDHDDLYHANRLEWIATWLGDHPQTSALCTGLFPFINIEDAPRLSSGARGWSRAAVERGTEMRELVAVGSPADVRGSGEHHVRTHEDLLGWYRGGAQLVMDRTLAITAGLYTTHARIAPDNLFLLNVSRLSDIVDLDQSTYFYRLLPGSASRKAEVPWGRVASVVAFRMGGLHMPVERAVGETGSLPPDPQVVDLLAESASRGELLRVFPQFRHLLNLYVPDRRTRLAIERRLVREIVTRRFPAVEGVRQKIRRRFPARDR